MSFAPAFYSSSRNTVTSVVGYAHKKGNLLHRGYNPAMKNKRSDTPEVCSVKVQICGKLSWPICAGTASACGVWMD